MTDSLFHRGPDGCGYHNEPGLSFGHRRLSIIDLAGGHQPMYSRDNSIVVTYNGEIYNFKEIRTELEQHGYVFSTNCDTEVILYAWDRWGESCVEKFNGMFAFAVLDKTKKTVFLARDRLGIKPFYYAELPNKTVLFGSELKALLAFPGLPRELDHLAVEEFFAFGYIPEPKTVLTHVKKLPPGHTLLIRLDSGRVESPKQYWDIVLGTDDGVSNNDLIDALRSSVRRRMIADVPLGAFLSGGVDSSAVVAMMAGISSDPINTCSISFGDPKFNEAQFAEVVAKQFSTDHHVRQADPDDFELLDHLASVYDEPYADSSAFPTYKLCQLAREQVTVALSGDGGDENFGGYRRYRWHVYEEKVRSVLPPFLRKPVFGLLGACYPKMDWAPKVFRAKSTLQALARNSAEGYLHSVSIMTDRDRAELFSDSFSKSLQGHKAIDVFSEHIAGKSFEHPLQVVQYLDFKTYLPGDILTKVDRASMAHSLEVRVPLLDHTFVELVAGIESEKKLKGREGKYVFKKSLEKYLPNDILYRSKMGFAVPIGSWFKGPLKELIRTQLLDKKLLESGIFDESKVRNMLDSHQAGTKDYTAPLWALLMFKRSFQNIF